ncbi:MAG: acetyltransferase [Lachnospiraceae bacterium]|jgi:sugar O-acyltransferase (sialic acid O-acetyltransferase NeuD family)|nr:acetyltransferase [Lachnospiraceae bacterium]
MGKKILLIGGGGHCRSVLDSLISLDDYDKIGIIDFDKSSCALDISVVGTDDDLPNLRKNGWTDAFITVGSLGSTQLRRKLYQKVKKLDYNIPTIIDPTAIIARKVILTEGAFVGKRGVVNSGSMVGACAIINTGAILEHDCKIGDFSHISPGTILCGQVVVDKDSHVGAGSVVKQGITIGKNALLGIGSVVVKNIPDDTKAYGNPCRVVE